MGPSDRELDELYAIPRDEFTPARNALAARLKQAGDAEGAAAVKALPKPTVAAAALNRLAREEPRLVKKLLDSGARLRAAQEQVIAGGGADALRRATAAERDAVRELAATVERRESPSPAVLDRIGTTLNAAALDEDAGRLLAAGRLSRELEAAGFPASGTPGAAPAAGRRAAASDEGHAEAERERLRRARLRDRLRALKRDLAEAQKDTARREREAARARAELDERERAAERAREHEAKLRQEVDTASDELA